MWAKYKHATGFTIVELLIVIVVIGILAAITIVAYSGIQQRARNAQTTSAASHILTAFKGYAAANGTYPPVSNTYKYCIGQPNTSCTAATANWRRDTNLETYLLTIMQPLPLPSDGPGTAATNDPNLGYIPQGSTPTTSPTLDGVNSAFLIYILEGNVVCPIGPVASGVWPSFFSAVPASGNIYYNSSSNVSDCWVPLASP